MDASEGFSGSKSRSRRSGTRRVSRLEYVVASGLALTLAGSALGLGAVHTVVLVPVAVVAFATSYAAQRLGQRTGGARWPLPALVCFALAAYTLLQCVPLPLSLLIRIAASNADVWRHSLDPLGQTVSYGSISLDPGASLRDALRWTMYGATFYSARTLARVRGASTGLAIVFGSAVLLAAVTLCHELVGATHVYGFYAPRFPIPPVHMGPLLNSNNLAGYLNLGALVGMGMLLARNAMPRAITGVGLALVGAIALRAASRAGVASLLVGLVVFGAIVLRRALRDGRRQRVFAAFGLVGGALFAGMLLTILGGTDTIRSELFSDNLIKLRLMSWVRPVVEAFPVFGLGRGAFESVFPAFRLEPSAYIVFTHVEDFPLQWAVEWGVPVGVAALVVFGYVLRPKALGATRSTAATGAAIGLYVMAAQNLLDLGFEIPALPLAFAVCAGSLLGDRHLHRRSADPPPPVAWAAPTLAGAGGALVLLAMIFGMHDVFEDRDQVREDYERMAPTAAGAAHVVDALRGYMRKHPADYYFPLVGASIAWRAKSPSAMAWLERTLERAPINGRAHVLLAEILIARNARRQALFELRLAATYSPELRKVISNIATQIAHGYEELLLAIPDGSEGAGMLSHVGALLGAAQQIELQERIDLEALSRDPTLTAPRARLTARRLDALAATPLAAPCVDPAPCREFLATQAAAFDRAEPEGSGGDQLRARELATRGELEAADALLVTACQRPGGRAACLQTRVTLLARVKYPVTLPGAVKAYLSEACNDPAQCAPAHDWVAGIYAQRGDWEGATLAYFDAAHIDPAEARWMRAADAASRAGLHARAVLALEALSHRRTGDATIQARILAERAAAQGIAQ